MRLVAKARNSLSALVLAIILSTWICPISHFKDAQLSPAGWAFAQTGIYLERVIERENQIKSESDKWNYQLLNLKKTQKAAENFASHNKGKYPTIMNDAFKSYFPLGNCDGKNYSTFTIPLNPYTKKPAWPKLFKNKSIKKKGPAGQIEYYCYPAKNAYTVYVRDSKGGLLKNKRGRSVMAKSSKLQLAMANARTVQWAAEHYAEAMKKYPLGITKSFKYYFPGGDPKKMLPGSKLFNPYSGKLNWPVTGKVKNIKLARRQKPTPLSKGIIEYSCLKNGKNYAIRIGGSNNFALSGIAGKSSTLVYGRDGDGRGHERNF